MSIALAAAFVCASPLVEDGTHLSCGTERIRLAAYDAPKLADNPLCQSRHRHFAWCNQVRGLRAKAELQRFLAQGQAVVTRLGYDRAGRTVARVTVHGLDAGAHLRSHGLVKRWFGRQVVRPLG